MDQNDILEVLRRVQHPETGTDLVSRGMIENLIVTGDKIQFTLAFSRSRDPVRRIAEKGVRNHPVRNISAICRSYFGLHQRGTP